MRATEILVTGAAGKTGTPVVRLLAERGVPVRALVRRDDERARHLEALGARVVVGDFLDLASIREAVKDVKQLYFCYPPLEGLLTATAHVAVAARDAGVETVVNMSQVSAREAARSPLSHDHWVSEQLLDWAGVGAVHLRPTFFAEDLYLFTGGSIGREGKMRLPFGNGKHAPVSAEDIARVVVGILNDRQPHLGHRYVVTGRHTMTLSQIADAVGRGLGRSVEYVNVPIESWRSAIVQQPDFPDYLATHLAAVAQDHQDGVFSAETDVVERIGGHLPQSVEAFARAHAARFQQSAVQVRNR
jgi:uncharacterized protein YbjT (DUF2867 family)